MHKIEEIIKDISLGKMVVITDAEDRENEGDLIMAAEAVTPESINFMSRYGRGLVCMPMTTEHTRRLGLKQQAADNGSRYGTRFTISIEAKEGVSTGISPADRAHTILTAANTNLKGALVSPGHIFPIEAHAGGLLARHGHTEASCELARLAGFKPMAVLCEIINEDGTMARVPDLNEFIKIHDLKMGTIKALVAYLEEQKEAVAC